MGSHIAESKQTKKEVGLLNQRGFLDTGMNCSIDG